MHHARRVSGRPAVGRRMTGSVVVIAVIVSALVAAPSVSAKTTSSTEVGARTSIETGVVKAANLADFQAGNIISDAVFFDRGTMSAAQIQSFLQSRVPNCQSGYVCLKDWYDTSRATAADPMCSAYPGGYRERASDIIYKVAQACGINPQVLLVTLQKEQGLVTHTWPSEFRYTIAMGQGCPDTAACDTRYYGFFNQVYGAARQFKRYANPPGTSQYFTWYAPGRTWNIGWHPNAACGSWPVYIQNQATANLYYYTPYQPNAAALRAGYGLGDGCSSYGNRNFYNYFTDWFGSTQSAASGPPPTISSVDTSSYVLALNDSGAVWGYPFAGGRGWGDAVKVATALPGTRRVLSVGDLDGDGHRDLVGVGGDGAASLYPGDGGLAFGAARAMTANWSGSPLISAAGDFDGDGTPDVFTTDSAGQLLLWRSTGWGSFRSPVVAGNGWGGFDLISGGTDMDGDRVPDLIARTTGGGLYLYTGNGSGGWRDAYQIGSSWSGMSLVFSPGDFSGDGLTDILARDGFGNLWRYHGVGGGRIAGGLRVGSGWHAMVDVAGTGPANTPARPRPAGAGDLDSDRAADVVAVTWEGQVIVYRGDGRGGWRGSVPAAEPWASGSRLVTLGDFSGEGIPDLGRMSPDGSFDLLRGRGDGTVDSGVSIGNGWNTLSMVAGGLDFDGDRNVDVIGRDAQGNLNLYRGDGAGGWAADATVIGWGWNGLNPIVYAGDFDGDLAPDLVARAPDGALWLYPTTGRGSWKDARPIGYGWAALTAIVGVGQFDGTGGSDVVARDSNGRLILFRGDGRGGWTGSTIIGNGWNGMAQIG